MVKAKGTSDGAVLLKGDICLFTGLSYESGALLGYLCVISILQLHSLTSHLFYTGSLRNPSFHPLV